MTERIKGGQELFAQLPPDQNSRIWRDAKIPLIWLEATYPSAYAVSPQEKIQIAQARARGVSIAQAAEEFGISTASVKTYTREAKVALLTSLPPNHYLRKRIEASRADVRILNKLNKARKQSQAAQERVYSPACQKELENLPHLRILLHHFSRYLTVRYLFENLNIPYDPNKIKGYNYLLRNYIFSPDKNTSPTIQGLARKVLFANWLSRSSPFRSLPEEKTINQSIRLAFTSTDPKTKPLRFFWKALTQASYSPNNSTGKNVVEVLDAFRQPYPPSLLPLLKTFVAQGELATYAPLIPNIPSLNQAFPPYAVKAVSSGLAVVENCLIQPLDEEINESILSMNSLDQIEKVRQILIESKDFG